MKKRTGYTRTESKRSPEEERRRNRRLNLETGRGTMEKIEKKRTAHSPGCKRDGWNAECWIG